MARSSRKIISAMRAETMPMPYWLAPCPSMMVILAAVIANYFAPTYPWSLLTMRFLLNEARLFPGMTLFFTFWFPDWHRARIVSGFVVAGHSVSPPVLTYPEPRRIRDRDHVRFVAQQTCLVCGREPCDAHHLRFAQDSALGR
jgi:hypothetical protein